MIAELGRDVPPTLVPRAVEVARRAADRRLRLRVLAMLAGLAEDPLRSSVADEVIRGLAVSPTVLAWDGLGSLALAATPEQAWEAIAIVRAGLRGADRDEALRILAAALDDPRLVDLVEELARPKPTAAVEVLEEYAASLSRPARARAMGATERIRDPGRRAIARAVVLAAGGRVDDVTADATLDLAVESGEEPTAEVIDRLAGQLPPGRVLQATLALRDPGTRWWALTSIVGRLPPEMAAVAERELRAHDEEGLAGGGGMGDGGSDEIATATAADAAAALGALFPAADGRAPTARPRTAPTARPRTSPAWTSHLRTSPTACSTPRPRSWSPGRSPSRSASRRGRSPASRDRRCASRPSRTRRTSWTCGSPRRGSRRRPGSPGAVPWP